MFPRLPQPVDPRSLIRTALILTVVVAPFVAAAVLTLADEQRSHEKLARRDAMAAAGPALAAMTSTTDAFKAAALAGASDRDITHSFRRAVEAGAAPSAGSPITTRILLLERSGDRFATIATSGVPLKQPLHLGRRSRELITAVIDSGTARIISSKAKAGELELTAAGPVVDRSDRALLLKLASAKASLPASKTKRPFGVAITITRKGRPPQILWSTAEVDTSRVPTYENHITTAGIPIRITAYANAAAPTVLTSRSTLLMLLAGLIASALTATLLSQLQRRSRDHQNHDAELQRATEQLAQSEQRYDGLFEGASDVVLLLDEHGCIVDTNRAGETVLGRRRDQLVGHRLVDLSVPESAKALETLLASAISHRSESARTTAFFATATGARTPLDLALRVNHEDDQVHGIQVIARDVTAQQEYERQLKLQAEHDALTGLANRSLLFDRVQGALQVSQRTAVLLIDLDEFKQINDNLGHAAGDDLLREVAKRIGSCMRDIDTCARLGGDEFAVLVDDLPTGIAPTEVAEQLLRALRPPIMLGGQPVTVNASIGIAEREASTRDPNELMRNADIAMYEAKSAGRNRHALFDESMLAEITARAKLIEDLEAAIDRAELVVRYQPIVRMDTGQVCAAEALIRWEHPTKGLLPPISFIPLAEETGMIVPIGRFVLREACKQAVAWQSIAPEMAVTFNISGRELEEPDFLSSVKAALASTGLHPSRLIAEITETLLIGDTGAADILKQLKGLGVQLAVDDFGAGYSSIDYLRRFPIDILKIDKGFTDRLDEERDADLFAAIVQLSHSIGIETVAEGIETRAQFDYVRQARCDRGQGYLFAKPIEAEEVSQLLRRSQPIAKASAA